MAQKAVFLDRDDTLINDSGYMQHPEQVNLLPGVPEALIQLKKMGYLLVIITNQSGVARGYFTEDELATIHKELKRQLASEGVTIDGLYYCPYHPDGTVQNYSIESNLRKPNAGMLFQAEKELDIDLSQSWKIGDSYRDIQAGKAAGCHTILVDVPGKVAVKKQTDAEPDRKAVNLREAVNIIRMHEFHQRAQATNSSPGAHQDPEEPDEPSNPSQVDETDSNQAETLQLESHTQVTTTPSLVTEVEPATDIPTEETNEPVESESPRFYTTKTPPRTEPQQDTGTNPETHHLLEEIAHRLKRKDREGLYQEFSVFKLLSLMVEVVAIFALVLSLCFWLNPKVGSEPVFVMIGYSVALQLIVIALLMMHSKD